MKIKSPSSSTVPAVIFSYVLTPLSPTVKSPFTCSKSSSDFILLTPHRLKSPSISSCPLSKYRYLPATFPLIFVLLPVVTISPPILIPPAAPNPASPPVELRLPAISAEPTVFNWYPFKSRLSTLMFPSYSMVASSINFISTLREVSYSIVNFGFCILTAPKFRP